jgi:hypothetical protein
MSAQDSSSVSPDLQQDLLPGRQIAPGDEQDTGRPPCSPTRPQRPGSCSRRCADDADREHHEQRPDAAADAQGPTAAASLRATAPARASTRSPIAKSAAPNAADSYPAAGPPPRPATIAAVSTARMTAVATAAAAETVGGARPPRQTVRTAGTIIGPAAVGPPVPMAPSCVVRPHTGRPPGQRPCVARAVVGQRTPVLQPHAQRPTRGSSGASARLLAGARSADGRPVQLRMLAVPWQCGE